MEVRGQPYSSATLLPEEQRPVRLQEETGWAPEPVCTNRRRGKPRPLLGCELQSQYTHSVTVRRLSTSADIYVSAWAVPVLAAKLLSVRDRYPLEGFPDLLIGIAKVKCALQLCSFLCKY